MLASELNCGYQDMGNIQVMAVGGVQVHNLAHLAQLLSSTTAPFIKLELEWKKVSRARQWMDGACVMS